MYSVTFYAKPVAAGLSNKTASTATPNFLRSKMFMSPLLDLRIPAPAARNRLTADAADFRILFSIKTGSKPIFQVRRRVLSCLLTCGAFYTIVKTLSNNRD